MIHKFEDGTKVTIEKNRTTNPLSFNHVSSLYLIEKEGYGVTSFDENMTLRSMYRKIAKIHGNAVVFEVWEDINGELSMQIDDQSGSELAGVAFMANKVARENYGTSRCMRNSIEFAKRICKEELEEYNHFIQGRVYNITLSSDSGTDSTTLIGNDLVKNGLKGWLKKFNVSYTDKIEQMFSEFVEKN